MFNAGSSCKIRCCGAAENALICNGSVSRMLMFFTPYFGRVLGETKDINWNLEWEGNRQRAHGLCTVDMERFMNSESLYLRFLSVRRWCRGKPFFNERRNSLIGPQLHKFESGPPFLWQAVRSLHITPLEVRGVFRKICSSYLATCSIHTIHV